MTIWIVAVVLIGLLGLVGYFLGAIRSTVVLLGVILGGVLAVPLGPSLRPLFQSCGLTNTVLLWIWPPVGVFGLVFLIFLGLSFAAHYPVAKHYKFTVDEYTFLRWRRVNQRLGACVSLLSGVLCLFFLSAGIYGVGYVSVPYAKEEGDPIWLTFINKARQDMTATGLDRIGAAWDPMPKKLYPAADILAALYFNLPGIRPRLADYPPFLTLGERSDFTDMAGDKEFMDAVSGKAGAIDLVNNSRLLGLINSPDIVSELLALDLVDFRNYLERGKSAKYDAFKVLGRWSMDADPLVTAARKSRTDLTPADLVEIRKAAERMARGTTLKATTDNKFSLSMKGSLADLKKLQAAKTNAPAPVAMVAPSAQPGYGGTSGMSAEMRRRYGLPAPAQGRPQGRPQGQPPEGGGEEGGAPAAPAAPPASPGDALNLADKTIQGTWDGEGNHYQFALRGPDGKDETVEVAIEQDAMTFVAMGQRFVFYRQ